MKTDAMKTAARRLIRAGSLSMALAALVPPATAALTEGRTNTGHRYLTGGVGIEEVDAMRAESARYSLQVITAAKTGAYLAGARVRITGPGNEVVLDTTIDAPWLLVDLPAGPYTVRATHSGNTAENRVTIAPGKTQRLTLHFDAPVDGEPPSETTGSARPRSQ